MRRILALCLVSLATLPFLTLGTINAQGVDVLDPVCSQTPRPEICEDNAAGSGQEGDPNPITGNEGILNSVINILSLVVGIACVLVIIISGLRFIVSAGDSNSISSARRSLLYAVVGLLIVVIARVLVRFVLSKLE